MPERHAPKPGTRHLLLRNVPADDLRALAIAAASAEPRTTPTELIRGLVHREAERLRAQALPRLPVDSVARSIPAFKVLLTIHGLDEAQIHELIQEITESIEKRGGEVGGGIAAVDADGNPLP